jgi:hypothetical protein
MLSPFALTDGLYLAEIFLAPFHSVWQSPCGAKDLVAQTRFVISDLPMYEFLSFLPSDSVLVVSFDFILSDAVPGLFLVLD